MDLDPAPVDDFGVLPAKMLVEIPLPAAAVGQILAPDDMSGAEQMVLHRTLEIQQRPDPVFVSYQWMRRGDDPKGGPVPDGRVLVVHVCLDPQHRLSLSNATVQHSPPEGQVLLHALPPVLALDPLVLVLLECRLRASADIGSPPQDQLLSYGVVLIHPLAGGNNQIWLCPQPSAVLQIPAISLRHGPLLDRIGVIKTDDEFAAVLLDVLGVDHDAPGASKRRRAVGVWGKAHDNALFSAHQSRQALIRLLLLRQFCKQLRSYGLQPLLPLLGAGLLHGRQDLCHNRRDLLGPGAQGRILTHELAHNRPGLGCGSVLNGVLQRILFYKLSDLFHEASPMRLGRTGREDGCSSRDPHPAVREANFNHYILI